MITPNTRESAIRRDEFHRVLQAWLDDTFDDRAGDVDSHAGSAWLWVRHRGEHYYLDAAATRDGIREYLRTVRTGSGEVEWQTDDSASDPRELVTIGRARTHIDGLELYRHVPRR
jgi:phage terminase large subunit-like protein